MPKRIKYLMQLIAVDRSRALEKTIISTFFYNIQFFYSKFN